MGAYTYSSIWVPKLASHHAVGTTLPSSAGPCLLLGNFGMAIWAVGLSKFENAGKRKVKFET